MRRFWRLAAALTLTACAPVDLAEQDPRQRFAVTVEQAAAQAVIANPLSATDVAVLKDLALEHRKRSAGAVTIEFAKGEVEFADQVVARLAELGVPANPVPTGTTAGTALVRVPVWVARVPECGGWSEPVNPDFRNQTSTNFGCAMTRNIGLMVQNPADLERAREASGRDGNRAVDVLTKYGQGKPTAAQAEESKPTATLSVVGTK